MKKILLIIIVLFMIAGGVFYIYYQKMSFKLIGNKEITVNYGEAYDEKGAKANIFKKDLSKQIIIKSDVDINKVGEYKVTYTLKNIIFTKRLTRKVKIIDNIPPTITLKGNNSVSLKVGEEFNEPGYEVTDNYDKERMIKVTLDYDKEIDVNKEGTYVITYIATDSSDNETKVQRKVIVEKENIITTSNGLTYIKGILLVNKTYSVPSTYAPGVNDEASSKLKEMQSSAKKLGYDLTLRSGYRSYSYQQTLYNGYVKSNGQAKADTFSAKPGHSEHQTGLAFDIGQVDDNFGNTPSGKWLAENAHNYGFIIRYQKGKENITGYMYEPWHVRYLGEKIANEVYKSGLSLEEYLGV